MNPLLAFLTLAALAATAPLWPSIVSEKSRPLAHAPDAWPAAFVSADWTRVPLAPRDERFERDFPGAITVFAAPGGHTLIVRMLRQPTRKLHPAADCLRAVGYAIEPRPIFRQAGGVEWAELHASRGNDTLRVRERLLGADGRRWTDVSAWYWSAALGRAAGPWWAITELAPE